jgi:hypothetical protein
VAGQQLVQHGAVRLRHDRIQQRGGGDHQHTGRLGAGGWVQVQAEAAVRHPAGLQALAVGVDAGLPTGLLLVLADGWGHQATRPRAAVLGSALQAQAAGRGRIRAVAECCSTSASHSTRS